MSHEKAENTKSEGEEQVKEEIKRETSDQPEEEAKEETKTIEASIDEVPSSYKRIGNSEHEGFGTQGSLAIPSENY